MDEKERWPNFFIVGAAKSGTTALYSYLNSTNGIYMSPVKEPGYFRSTKKDPQSRAIWITDKAKYLKLFSDVKNEKAIGEATPGYLRDPGTAELIHEKVPNAKIIIILRNPIQRAFSGYLMRKRNGQEKRTFLQIIKDFMKDYKDVKTKHLGPISGGLYTSNVKRYVNIFGSENVKILIFEEFIKDASNQINEVFKFLGVDSELPVNIDQVYNAYGEPRGKISEMVLGSILIYKIGMKLVPQNLRWRVKDKLFLNKKEKPKISEEARILLQKFYKEDVKDLEKFLCRKLPWKWFNESEI